MNLDSLMNIKLSYIYIDKVGIIEYLISKPKLTRDRR